MPLTCCGEEAKPLSLIKVFEGKLVDDAPMLDVRMFGHTIFRKYMSVFHCETCHRVWVDIGNLRENGTIRLP